MKTIAIREFAALCMKAARGENVEDGLKHVAATGRGTPALMDLAKHHRVLALLAAPMTRIAPDDAVASPAFHASRHMHLRAQLTQLDSALAARGIRAMLLKGSIQLFNPVYPSIGMRDMADIDILIDDIRAIETLSQLGYQPVDQTQDMPRDLTVPPGEYHLPPVLRERDLVALEPHVLPASPLFMRFLSKEMMEAAQPVSGTNALCLPEAQDHLHHMLVHTIGHDRDTLDGGLFIRSLVECELLLEGLSPDQRQSAEETLSARGGRGLWVQWRALADWCFRQDDSARFRSPKAWWLITEFQLRAKGRAAELSIALLNRLLRILHPRYWTSGAFWRHAKRLVQRDFWQRLYSKIGAALTG